MVLPRLTSPEQARIEELAKAIGQVQELVKRVGKDPSTVNADIIRQIMEDPEQAAQQLGGREIWQNWPYRLAQLGSLGYLTGRGLGHFSNYPIVDPGHFRTAVEQYAKSPTASKPLAEALAKMTGLTDAQLHRVLHEAAVTGTPIMIRAPRTVAHTVDVRDLASLFDRLARDISKSQEKGHGASNYARQVAAELAHIGSARTGDSVGNFVHALRRIAQLDEAPAYLKHMLSSGAPDEYWTHLAKEFHNQLHQSPMAAGELSRAYRTMVQQLSEAERDWLLKLHENVSKRVAAGGGHRRGDVAMLNLINDWLAQTEPIARRSFGTGSFDVDLVNLSPRWLSDRPTDLHQIGPVNWLKTPPGQLPTYTITTADDPFVISADTLKEITRRVPKQKGGYRRYSSSIWPRWFSPSQVNADLSRVSRYGTWFDKLLQSFGDFGSRITRSFSPQIQPRHPDVHIVLDFPEAGGAITPKLYRAGQEISALRPSRFRWLESARGRLPTILSAGILAAPTAVSLAAEKLYGGTPLRRLTKDLANISRQLQELQANKYLDQLQQGGLQKLLRNTPS